MPYMWNLSLSTCGDSCLHQNCWAPPMGTGGSPTGYSSQHMKITTHLHLVLVLTNMWICTFKPTYTSLTWCLFTHTNKFSFTYWMMKQYLNIPHPRYSLFNKWTSIKNTMFYARINTVSFLDRAVFNLTYVSEI